MIAILETHPVQYHAPVYRYLAERLGAPVTVIYGSDFSISGYYDREFASKFSWDTDLISGYYSIFLNNTRNANGDKNSLTVTEAGLATELDRIKPKVVLSLGYSHRFDRAGIRWALRTKTPLLIRAETNDEAFDRSWLKTILRDWHLRRLYRRCARLLPIGEASARHYRRLGVPESRLTFSRYCVATNCHTPSDFDKSKQRNGTRARIGAKPDSIVVAYAGKLSHRKGVDLIPKAIEILEDPLKSRVHLLFIGNGNLQPTLSKQCLEAHSPISHYFAGFQNQTQLSPFYHAADILTLPSRYGETWGLVVNEGLAHGVPCIVSERVGCHLDLIRIGVSGEIFASDDPDSLAAAITRLSMARNGSITTETCRNAVAAYSIEAAARGILEAYHQVL